jgi:hypothetical protein
MMTQRRANIHGSMSFTDLKFLARQKGYELLPADDRPTGYRLWYEKKPAGVTIWDSALNPATGDDVFPSLEAISEFLKNC